MLTPGPYARSQGKHKNSFIATLHAMLWCPEGYGSFPGILLNHGSGRTREDLERRGPYEQNAEKLGLVFARHGYIFLYLFRRGVGLSANQGANAVDLMNSESATHGQEARNTLSTSPPPD
jgi:hypothetical protein